MTLTRATCATASAPLKASANAGGHRHHQHLMDVFALGRWKAGAGICAVCAQGKVIGTEKFRMDATRRIRRGYPLGVSLAVLRGIRLVRSGGLLYQDARTWSPCRRLQRTCGAKGHPASPAARRKGRLTEMALRNCLDVWKRSFPPEKRLGARRRRSDEAQRPSSASKQFLQGWKLR
jgi:hypothetical protein